MLEPKTSRGTLVAATDRRIDKKQKPETALPYSHPECSFPGSYSSVPEDKSVSMRRVIFYSDTGLREKVNALDDCTELPEDIKKDVVEFAETVLDMELPLYHPAFISMLSYVQKLKEACHSDSDRVSSSTVTHIKSIFADIIKLFPYFFECHEDGAPEFISYLLKAGIVKGEIKDFNDFTEIKILNLIIKLPFSVFILFSDQLFESKSFRELFLNDVADEVITNCDVNFFNFWEEQLKLSVDPFSEEKIKELKKKSLINVILNKDLPKKLNCKFVKEIMHFNILPSIMKTICEKDFTDLTAYKLLSRIAILHEQFPNILTPFLQNYLASCRAATRKKILLASFMSGNYSFTKTFFNKQDFEVLNQWRDPQGRTLLHSDVFSYRALHAESKYVCNLVNIACLREVRDQQERTPLESYFTYTFYGGIPANGLLQQLLNDILKTGSFPAHCNDLLAFASKGSALQLVFLITLVQNGFSPEQLSLEQLSKAALEKLGPQEYEFPVALQRLLCRYRPLATQQQQVGFLSELKAWKSHGKYDVPIGRSIAESALEVFPLQVRAAFMEPPLTLNSKSIWESELLPLVEKYTVGRVCAKSLPWTLRLHEAMVCYQQMENSDVLKIWMTACQRIPKQNEIVDYENISLPSGTSGVYGRSCFFKDGNQGRTLRFKFRKKSDGTVEAEPWQEFASEPVKLRCLRELQENGQLPLESCLPKPVGIYKIPLFESWLARLPLALNQQQALHMRVYQEKDGAVFVYVYETEYSEYYELYPQDAESAGLSLNDGIAALKTAAHDLGLLAGAGLAATVLPMFHYERTNRRYVILAQLADKDCPGVLDNWDSDATDYPNISPGVGIRDYADIYPFRDILLVLEHTVDDTAANRRRIYMEQIGREFLSLVLLLAKTRSDHLNFRNETAIRELQNDLTDITEHFFSSAFDLPQGWLTKTMNSFGILERLAREIAFWCDRTGQPQWVQYIKNGTMPQSVYPKTFATPFDVRVSTVIPEKGTFNTTKSRGQRLGHRNGMLPIMELNKLLTLAFSLYVHREKPQ